MPQRPHPFLHAHGLALGLALLHLLVGLALLPDYGPTWDPVLGDFAYGERILEAFGHGEPVHLEADHPVALAHREPHPDFVLGFGWKQLFPFAATLSAASCQLFFTTLGWLPALPAHHLPIVLLGSLLVYVLVRFAQPRLGAAAAAAAVVLLDTSPRFFAHGFNNLKDAPEACLYAFAVIAGFHALTGGRARTWCLLGAVTGLALAQKANALFLPVHLVLFALWLRWRKVPRSPSGVGRLAGVGLAALCLLAAYLACSPVFWQDGWSRFSEHALETVRVGNRVVSGRLAPATGSAAVSAGGLEAFLLTTPPVLLVLALVGACSPRLPAALRGCLLLWLLIPVGRTALPGMRNFDGVRHFLELYPALALLGGHGLTVLLRVVRPRLLRAAAAAALLAPGALATWSTHPNGICYYNFLGGGLAGRQAAGDVDATDYWGNSYWQAIHWLNDHAASGARILAPINPAILACGAAVELRPDLTVWKPGLGGPTPLYVVYITRRNWYGPLVTELDRDESTVVHEIRVQGGVVLRIHALPDAEAFAPYADLVQRERRTEESVRRIAAWVREHPEHAAELIRITETTTPGDLESAEAELRELLPPELMQAARDALQDYWFERER